MIPAEEQAKILWKKYHVSKNKQRHMLLVAKAAMFIAQKLQSKNRKLKTDVLLAAALLHDIDKQARKLLGEEHPDTAVRILKEEDMEEVAELVATHPLHTILNPTTAPKTWEEKVLFLADKMVRYDVMTVDERFRLWNDEHLPAKEQRLLDRSYPKVKQLEREIFRILGLEPSDVSRLA